MLTLFATVVSLCKELMQESCRCHYVIFVLISYFLSSRLETISSSNDLCFGHEGKLNSAICQLAKLKPFFQLFCSLKIPILMSIICEASLILKKNCAATLTKIYKNYLLLKESKGSQRRK